MGWMELIPVECGAESRLRVRMHVCVAWLTRIRKSDLSIDPGLIRAIASLCYPSGEALCRSLLRC